MDLWRRLRVDLTRPERPIGRDEVPFLTGAALVIVVVAQVFDPGTPAELAGLLPAVAAFVARGLVPRMPMEAFALAVVGPVTLVVGHDAHLEVALFLPTIVTLYAAWYLGSTTRGLLLAAVNGGAPWLVATHLVPEAELGWAPWTAAVGFTYAMGLALRRQDRLIDELRAAREALAEQAVAEERRRVARELHDLAGHTLAAVLLHVTGARHVLRRDPEEAERALRDAEAVGRASLDQIRATVAALRTDERGTDPALADAADLGELVAEYRRAGLRVRADLDESTARVTGPPATALHRIAREALANVARHAPGNEVALTTVPDDEGVRLVVADHGRPARPPAPGGGHFGLVGMRERARALGGDLEAGPTATGWRVEARIPRPGFGAPGAAGTTTASGPAPVEQPR